MQRILCFRDGTAACAYYITRPAPKTEEPKTAKISQSIDTAQPIKTLYQAQAFTGRENGLFPLMDQNSKQFSFAQSTRKAPVAAPGTAGGAQPTRLARWDRRLFDAGQNVPLVAPCLLVLLATLLFRVTEADMWISGLFHDGASENGFSLANHPVLLAIYYWGLVPAWLLGLGSLAVLAVAAFREVGPERKRASVFLLAFLVLGPIVLVNVVYKGHWGRPRPDQTIPFGGDQPFVHVLDRGLGDNHYSFPSGHAAAGFCMIAPAFLLYRRHPRLAAACLAFGLGCGVVVGMGRVVQGRHFASDVLWAAAFLYFVGCALDYLLLSNALPAARRAATVAEPLRRRLPAAVAAGPRTGSVAASQPARPRREAA